MLVLLVWANFSQTLVTTLTIFLPYVCITYTNSYLRFFFKIFHFFYLHLFKKAAGNFLYF